jgi:hypothetical protein
MTRWRWLVELWMRGTMPTLPNCTECLGDCPPARVQHSEPTRTMEQQEASQTSQQSVHSRRRRGARRYAFACAPCKSRKVKCSGEQPVCSACRRCGAACTWQTSYTETRLEHATERIHQLEQALIQVEANPRDSQPRLGDATNSGPETQVSPLSVEVQPSPSSAHLGTGASLWYQIGRGEDGTVIYNGPTSRFHVESLEDDPAEDASPQREEPPDGARAARRAAYVEALASQYDLLENVCTTLIPVKLGFEKLQLDINMCMTLLDIYWTWLQPLHNCVYRPSETTSGAIQWHV